MWEKLQYAWNIKEVRNGLLFALAMMLVFRLVANIPIPGVDLVALRAFIEGNRALGLLNLFAGGTIRNFSIVAMGVAPYITASIIVQLLGMIFPKVEEIQKDGEAGRRRLNQWTRVLTVPLAIIQSFGLLAIMRQSAVPILTNNSVFHIAMIIATVTAGTMFLMWIGELIQEKKVGNGMSLLIAAGILADLPASASQFLATFDASQNWLAVVLYVLAAVAMVVGIIFITEGQRNVPVQYARQVRGGTGASTLPLRINMTGVIPIIFAMSILLFPTLVAQFLIGSRTVWLADGARWVIATMQNQTLYAALYLVLTVAFTYFYTSIVFQPEKIAENLQKQGAFVPGIRPGRATAEYLNEVISRITLGGALFLGVIAVTPFIAQYFTKTQVLALGGTSLLIVISVVIESVKQVESQVTMRQYDSY
ncbi:preprotein translocase subunit SecY [Patescibacteria group bacterium]|jgi:preprotein translocase subunit SecY|nr:preprotein translocase subunit SecY [Patescibacteria group bacterium]MDQ5919650.1 preprotein translocase subunit SecY [Patescibacteria group bacterium]